MYNKKELLKKCIDSIDRQDYPKDKIELIIVDGGSTDGSWEMVENLKFDHKYHNLYCLYNKNRLPEGKGNGKWMGYNAISKESECVAFIDQDNEIQGTNWLENMIEPMTRGDNVFGCHSRLLCKPKDALINRYVALIGTDPFAAYRSIDGYLGFKGYRIFNPFGGEGEHYLFMYQPKDILVAGGNCFIYRRSTLDAIGGYTQDTDNIYEIAIKGFVYPCIYIPDAYTWHHATSSVWDFLKKKMLWGKNPSSKKFKWIPEDFSGRCRLAANVICNFTVVLNVYIGIKNAIRDGESAWLLHPYMAFATTMIYGINFVKSAIRKIFKE